MTKDEALREAIDTLKSTKHGNCDFAWIDETLKKCTEALAQPPLPVQEPVAWNKNIRDRVDSLLAEAGYQPDSSARNALSMMNFATPPLPVQPERQPLTDEQIKVIHFDLCNTVGSDYKTVARAIEAAHNIGAKP